MQGLGFLGFWIWLFLFGCIFLNVLKMIYLGPQQCSFNPFWLMDVKV